MKYIAVLDTDDYEDFEFYEDSNGKYIHGIDAGSVNGEWLPLYFTECEQEPFINKPCVSSGACEHDKNVVLDKIKAVIEKQEKWLSQAGYNAYNVDIAFYSIKLALSKSKGGRNERKN